MKKKTILVSALSLFMMVGIVSCGDDNEVIPNPNPDTETNYVKGTDTDGKTTYNKLLFDENGNPDEKGIVIGNGEKEMVFKGKETLAKGTYLLKGWIYVADGSELTIEAGTIIKGDDGAHQNAKQRVGEADKEVGKPRFVLQRSHGLRHGGHAGHQDGKADHDGADALPLFAFAHIQEDAEEGQHRAEGGGFEHLDPEAVALQTRQTQDPAGDRGADVAAHDHADGLMQLHDAAVDKADHHDGGGTGALDHGRDAQTKEEAFEGIIGQLAQDFLQLTAGLLFEGLAHDVHTEQKQGQTAKEGKDIENRHITVPHFYLTWCSPVYEYRDRM